MSTLVLEERDIEVALRWSEVCCFKMFAYLNEHDCYSIDSEKEYRYENKKILVSIHLVKGCVYPDGRILRYPRIRFYLSEYEDDYLMSFVLHNEECVALLRSKFSVHIGPKSLCVCGRMGRNHLLTSESGKCNNCYIYGMIRGEECAICKEDDGKPWIKTSCEHYFHDMCWYRIHSDYYHDRRCPMCRSIQNDSTITKI